MIVHLSVRSEKVIKHLFSNYFHIVWRFYWAFKTGNIFEWLAILFFLIFSGVGGSYGVSDIVRSGNKTSNNQSINFQKLMVGEVFSIVCVFWYQVWLKLVQLWRATDGRTGMGSYFDLNMFPVFKLGTQKWP